MLLRGWVYLGSDGRSHRPSVHRGVQYSIRHMPGRLRQSSPGPSTLNEVELKMSEEAVWEGSRYTC